MSMKRQRRPSLVNTEVPDEDIARLSMNTFFQNEFLVLQMRALYVLVGANAIRALLGLWQGDSLVCQAALLIPHILMLLLLSFVTGLWAYFDQLAAGLALAECVNSLLCLESPLLPCVLAVMLYPAIFRIRLQLGVVVSVAATVIVQLLSTQGRQMDLVHRMYWLLAVVFTWWMSQCEKNLVLQLCKERIRLEREERRSGSLLARMLPASTSYRLKEGEHHIASRHQSVTILFAKILHVTEYAQQMPPERLLALLNDVYFRFDQLMDQSRVYKIETVGEVYVACSGLPLSCPDHAVRCARVAFAMLDAIQDFRGPDGKALELKIGVHSGEIVSGVIGVLLPRYRLFGDSINTASRMCTNAPRPGAVMCSMDTRILLGSACRVTALEPRSIKGKGVMELFLIDSADASDMAITATSSADSTGSAVGEDVPDTIGYEVEMEVKGGAVCGRGKVLAFVAFQAIVLVRSSEEGGGSMLSRSFGSLVHHGGRESWDEAERVGSGGRIKMNSWSSRSPSTCSDPTSPPTPHATSTAPPPTPPRERRRSIMQAFIPPLDRLKHALHLMPMRLSDEKFGIPLDLVDRITHTMDRSKVELELHPTANSQEPLQVDLQFEGSWLKHEFVTTLTDAIGPDAVVDDLLVPASIRTRYGNSVLPTLASIVRQADNQSGVPSAGSLSQLSEADDGEGAQLKRAVSSPAPSLAERRKCWSGQGVLGTGLVKMTKQEVSALHSKTRTSPALESLDKRREALAPGALYLPHRRGSGPPSLPRVQCRAACEQNDASATGSDSAHRRPGPQQLFVDTAEEKGSEGAEGGGDAPWTSPAKGALRSRGGRGGEGKRSRHVEFGHRGDEEREAHKEAEEDGRLVVTQLLGPPLVLSKPAMPPPERPQSAWRDLAAKYWTLLHAGALRCWICIQTWDALLGWRGGRRGLGRTGRRGSLPTVAPLSRSMTWRMGGTGRRRSSFSLCKDEDHAEAWRELIEALRQRQQRPLSLRFDHPVVEQFCQAQLGCRYHAVLALKLLLFIPLLLVDVTDDVVHLTLQHTALGSPPGSAPTAEPARAWLLSMLAAGAWLVPLLVAAGVGAWLACSIANKEEWSVQRKGWLWSALLVAHAGYVGARGWAVGGALPAWKQEEQVHEAVACLLLAALLNDAGWVRTCGTVALIWGTASVRAAVLVWEGSGTRPWLGLHSISKTALAVLLVVFQSETVVREHFRNTALVQHEISTSRTVLRNLLPRHIIALLVKAAEQEAIPPPCDKFHSVTILFADIVSFTAMSARLTPQQLVDMLNEIFSDFDRLAMKNKVYKVETIGDCYFCATGMPDPDDDHADNMLRMAVDMQATAESFVSPTGDKIRFRIGIDSGPVVAGVVGRRMPRYHLFGKTINKAESMEQGGAAGRVQVSRATYALLSAQGRHLLSACGFVEPAPALV